MIDRERVIKSSPKLQLVPMSLRAQKPKEGGGGGGGDESSLSSRRFPFTFPTLRFSLLLILFYLMLGPSFAGKFVSFFIY